MRKSVYKFILIMFIAFSLIVINLAFYMIGIIDMSSMSKLVDKRFATVQKSIDNSNNEIDSIIAQVSEDNLIKAKAISIMMNQSPKAYLDSEELEETRIALSVDEISITDEKGIVIAGTSPYLGQDFHNSDIEKQFLSAIDNKSYTNVVNIKTDGIASQYAGVARLDKPGVILIKATSNYLTQAIKLVGISNVTSGLSTLKKGNLAIINKNSWEYVSHTDETNIGKTVQIAKTQFKTIKATEKGKFKMKIQGVSSYVYYKNYNENIILADIPLSEVYTRRNYVVVSLIIALPILCLIAILAIRKKMIDYKLE